jgi:hypothetical protein
VSSGSIALPVAVEALLRPDPPREPAARPSSPRVVTPDDDPLDVDALAPADVVAPGARAGLPLGLAVLGPSG